MTRRAATRMMRFRTMRRDNLPGQPARPVTNPDLIPSKTPGVHHCSECFGPRSANGTLFCYRCEQNLFGSGLAGVSGDGTAYRGFIQSEAARRVQVTAVKLTTPQRRERDARVNELHAQGMPWALIAAEVGAKEATIYSRWREQHLVRDEYDHIRMGTGDARCGLPAVIGRRWCGPLDGRVCPRCRALYILDRTEAGR